MRPLTVCVPSRTPARLHDLLMSLGPQDPEFVRIVVGDNGLRIALEPQVVMVPVPDPFIFAQAINRCAERRIPGSDLLILNDDVRVKTSNWSDIIRLTMDLEFSRVYGIVSPQVIGCVGNPDQQSVVPTGEIMKTRRPICFLSAFIRHEVWARIGQMDERFDAYGGEDVDYCRRTVEDGWQLGVLGGVVVSHPQQSSTYQERFGHTLPEEGQRALRIFEAKWGCGPQLGVYEWELR